MNDNNLKCIEAGNWYSEYQCIVCGRRYVEQAEDSTYDFKCQHGQLDLFKNNHDIR